MMDIDNSRVPANCGTCGNYDRENGELTEACGVCRVMTGGASVPSAYKAKPMTNGDRIRAMTDEELAKLFTQTVVDGCPPDMDWTCKKDEEGWDACDSCWLKWLKQPAEVDGDGET